jgi:hypothetical protein
VERLKPGSFCLYVYQDDQHGGNQWNATFFFDDVRDALAYLRAAEIPRSLFFFLVSSEAEMEELREAEHYLTDELIQAAIEDGEEVDGGFKERALHVLTMIDRALENDTVSREQFEPIRAAYNEFTPRMPVNTVILEFGNVVQILNHEDVRPSLEELAQDAEDDSEDEDAQGMAKLDRLIETGTFDDNNEEHLELAGVFLDSITPLE